jgi:hypothetical protein
MLGMVSSELWREIKKIRISFLPAFIVMMCAMSLTHYSRDGRGASIYIVVVEAGIFILGLCLLVYGFTRFRKEWRISDTPISTVRGIAMGTAKLVGFAHEKTLIKSPISQSNCVFYKFRREEGEGGADWEIVTEQCSTERFYLDDRTGRILVDPLNNETILNEDYQHTNTKLFNHSERFTEWYIEPGDKICITGTVMKNEKAIQDRRLKLTERLEQLKINKKELMKFDLDGNGHTSVEEWDYARKKVEQEMIEEEINKPVANEDGIVITRDNGKGAFIVSDKDEAIVSQGIDAKGYAYILLGSIIVIVCAILLAKNEIFSSQFCYSSTMIIKVAFGVVTVLMIPLLRKR